MVMPQSRRGTRIKSLKRRKRRGKIKRRDGGGGRIENEKIRIRKTRKIERRTEKRRRERGKEKEVSKVYLITMTRNDLCFEEIQVIRHICSILEILNVLA